MNGLYSVGDIVMKHWRLTRLIGEGSFGKVYEGVREEFETVYRAAIKIITIPQNQNELVNARAEGMDDESITTYFRSCVQEIVQEFNLMNRLKGTSNVVSYEDHEVVAHDGGFGWDIIIRMELLTPLLTYTVENPLSRRDVIQLGIDLCKALTLCQRYNIIHRDIKPENIFISELGDFKLGDFGIARTVEKTTGGLSKKGTYAYMAPEVYKGQAYGSSVDVYSLGLVLYRLLNNNRNPFLPDYPAPIRSNDREEAFILRMSGEPLSPPKNADGRLAEIVLKACAFDQKNRYSSPLDMERELEAIQYRQGEEHTIYPDGDNVPLPPSADRTGGSSSSSTGLSGMIPTAQPVAVSKPGVEPAVEPGVVSETRVEPAIEPAAVPSTGTKPQEEKPPVPQEQPNGASNFGLNIPGHFVKTTESPEIPSVSAQPSEVQPQPVDAAQQEEEQKEEDKQLPIPVEEEQPDEQQIPPPAVQVPPEPAVVSPVEDSAARQARLQAERQRALDEKREREKQEQVLQPAMQEPPEPTVDMTVNLLPEDPEVRQARLQKERQRALEEKQQREAQERTVILVPDGEKPNKNQQVRTNQNDFEQRHRQNISNRKRRQQEEQAQQAALDAEINEQKEQKKRREKYMEIILGVLIGLVFGIILIISNNKEKFDGSTYSSKKVASVVESSSSLSPSSLYSKSEVEKEVDSVSIAVQPTKRVYYVGEEFDPSGLELTVDYTNGSSETIQEGFETPSKSFSKNGVYIVPVSYSGKETDVSIAVVSQRGLTDSGKCGENVSWELKDHVLTLSGSGKMYDYAEDNPAPWKKYESEIVKIEVGNNITSIGDFAFYMASPVLLGIEIGNAVSSIGECALNGLLMETLFIPKSVSSIKENAFISCGLLESFEVDSSNKFFSSYMGVLYNKDTTTLVCYPAAKTGDFCITYTVREIISYAFSGCHIAKLTLGTNVSELHPEALRFSSIEEIEISSANSSFCCLNGILYSKGLSTLIRCFSDASTIQIPEGVKTIFPYAFEENNSLRNITLPESLETIDFFAFANCTSIKKLTIPYNAISLNLNAFYGWNEDQTLCFENEKVLQSWMQKTMALILIVKRKRYL